MEYNSLKTGVQIDAGSCTIALGSPGSSLAHSRSDAPAAVNTTDRPGSASGPFRRALFLTAVAIPVPIRRTKQAHSCGHFEPTRMENGHELRARHVLVRGISAKMPARTVMNRKEPKNRDRSAHDVAMSAQKTAGGGFEAECQQIHQHGGRYIVHGRERPPAPQYVAVGCL
jgi:hypothetical protein